LVGFGLGGTPTRANTNKGEHQQGRGCYNQQATPSKNINLLNELKTPTPFYSIHIKTQTNNDILFRRCWCSCRWLSSLAITNNTAGYYNSKLPPPKYQSAE
jgi:hypothetical protein